MDPSTETLMEQVCRLQRELCWKINLIWSHSMRQSCSAYELFTQPLYTHTNISTIKKSFFVIPLKTPKWYWVTWFSIDTYLDSDESFDHKRIFLVRKVRGSAARNTDIKFPGIKKKIIRFFFLHFNKHYDWVF